MNTTNLSISEYPYQSLHGVNIMLLGIVTGVIYGPCAYVMATDSELKINSCYRLMFLQAVCDFINLLMNFSVGFLYTFSDIILPYWFNKVYFGTLCAMGWMVYLSLIHAIALNRCLTVVFFHKTWVDVIFSEKATKVWMGICFGDGLIWWFLVMSPYFDVIYDPSSQFLVIVANAWSTEIHLAMLIHMFICVYVSVAWYLVITCCLIATRKSMTTKSTEIQNIQKRERKVMKQAAIICLYPLFLDVWFYGNILFGIPCDGVPYHYAWMANSLRKSMTTKSTEIQNIQKRERKVMKQAAIICLYPLFLDVWFYGNILFGIPCDGVPYHYAWMANSLVNPF